MHTFKFVFLILNNNYDLKITYEIDYLDLRLKFVYILDNIIITHVLIYVLCDWIFTIQNNVTCKTTENYVVFAFTSIEHVERITMNLVQKYVHVRSKQ